MTPSPTLSHFLQVYRTHPQAEGHQLTVVDAGHAIEIKVTADSDWYFVVEVLEGQLVCARLREADREIPFDLGGFGVEVDLQSAEVVEVIIQFVSSFP